MTDQRPVLDQINLVVRDMDATMAFYRRLGVEIAPAPPPWDRHHRTATMPAGIDVDIDSAAFARQWDDGWPEGGTGVVLGFRVATREAVDATYADLVADGHEGQQAPYDAFWGARYAVMLDPEGNAVGLMSPIDPQRRAAPPSPPATG